LWDLIRETDTILDAAPNPAIIYYLFDLRPCVSAVRRPHFASHMSRSSGKRGDLNIGKAVCESHEPSSSSICPLPPDVIAQIKSSSSVTSLGGVILELLKNSLDGDATKIELAVDFSKGACIVEDNGLGIEPREFGESGGLLKLYCKLASNRVVCRQLIICRYFKT
jgi:hypothetical protein